VGRRPVAETAAGRDVPTALAPKSTETDPMDSMYVLKPAEDAAEEAARAIQIALDPRDNGGAAGK